MLKEFFLTCFIKYCRSSQQKGFLLFVCFFLFLYFLFSIDSYFWVLKKSQFDFWVVPTGRNLCCKRHVFGRKKLGKNMWKNVFEIGFCSVLFNFGTKWFMVDDKFLILINNKYCWYWWERNNYVTDCLFSFAFLACSAFTINITSVASLSPCQHRIQKSNVIWV